MWLIISNIQESPELIRPQMSRRDENETFISGEKRKLLKTGLGSVDAEMLLNFITGSCFVGTHVKALTALSA